MAEGSTQIPWLELVSRILDWPVTMPVLIVMLLIVFRTEMKAVLNRSNIKVSWGDKAIELNELEDNIDRDLDPIKEQLDALEAKLQVLEEKENTKDDQEADSKETNRDNKLSSTESAAILKALSNKKYRYRTASGIAHDTNLPRTKIIKALGQIPTVQKASSRDGRPIFTLKASSDGKQNKS